MTDKNLILRCLVWDLGFFALCLFCIFYLKAKPEIKNFDVIFPFLPLVFLSFSTEIFKQKQFKIVGAVDFAVKVAAYVFAQLVFRHIAVGAYFWVCIALFATCFATSIALLLASMAKSKKN